MSNFLTRRSLMERLKQMGMCPDLHNDEDAVRQVAEQTGIGRDEIARELVEMRAERGQEVLKAYGLKSPPQAFLASLAASRETLSDQRPAKHGEEGRRFYDSLFQQTPERTGHALGGLRTPFSMNSVRRQRAGEAQDLDRRSQRRQDWADIDMP